MNTSIIITTFQRPVMLAELLEALGPQLANRAAEAIIIDNCPDGSAQATVAAADRYSMRYVHEPRSGVVHARNRGVTEARGAYVIFLDDDEVPCAGWIDAWLTQANGKTDMAFGRIIPRLLAPCPPGLSDQIGRAYSRDMHAPTGTDISARWAYLGTGNAMFHKSRCFATDEPFDHRFNVRGGEDVWLIRSLERQGRRLLWNHEALVEELVPTDRMTLAFSKARKFNQGQLRCILMYGEGGLTGSIRVAIWMAAGAIQLLLFGITARLLSVLSPGRELDFQSRAAGGAGKLFWWRTARLRAYGTE